MIQVTKPYLPNRSIFNQYVDDIFERNWMTNNGPLVLELESIIKDFLDIPYFQMVTNGTIALQLAIRALKIQGEVITTPYSYVATTSSILWVNCTPVFTDVKLQDANIEPEKIEACITEKTTAILATHVYGLPCDVDAIEKIARKYGLKVLYDAAHAFGVKWRNRALVGYGDMATLSFHATKVYHTIEGGGIVCHDEQMNENLFLSKSFGHRGDKHYQLGINGKMSEFHAAMGLCVLQDFENLTKLRRNRWEYYKNRINSERIRSITLPERLDYNYGYFPLFFDSEGLLLRVIAKLNERQIFPRRYFYPALNQLPYLKNKVVCKNAEVLAKTVLCLPLYHDLEFENIDLIIETILSITEE
jgi:dTDP-4-amino-4,6-dideoxygalactose transaminase